MIKKILLFLFGMLIAFLLYLGGVIAFGTWHDYSPPDTQNLAIKQNPNTNNLDSLSSVNILIWNIGYSGLGKNANFFYDGGDMVRSPLHDYKQYFEEIKKLLIYQDSIDFILLQEVDELSKRSYYYNQVDTLLKLMPKYGQCFAYNYHVPFVPMPLYNPMGKVHGGLVSFFKHRTSKAVRIGFNKENFPYPKNIFFLDRAMIENRFNLPNGKQLVLYNTHKSAYDETGKLKKSEMEIMKKIVEEEYNKGNYVIVGGDWNQSPPNGNQNEIANIDKSFLNQHWQWVYDNKTPTNRDLANAYKANETPTSIIDFYLCSDNLQVQYCKTIDVGFSCSDHQPVFLKCKFL